MAAEAPEAPMVRDSDVIYLAVKRLEAAADKMTRLEYDANVDRLLKEAAELLEWVAYNIGKRADDQEVSGNNNENEEEKS